VGCLGGKIAKYYNKVKGGKYDRGDCKDWTD